LRAPVAMACVACEGRAGAVELVRGGREEKMVNSEFHDMHIQTRISIGHLI